MADINSISVNNVVSDIKTVNLNGITYNLGETCSLPASADEIEHAEIYHSGWYSHTTSTDFATQNGDRGGIITLKKSGRYMIVGGQSNQYGGTYNCTVTIKKGGVIIDSFSFGGQYANKYWLGNLDVDTVITMTSGSCFNFLIHIIKLESSTTSNDTSDIKKINLNGSEYVLSESCSLPASVDEIEHAEIYHSGSKGYTTSSDFALQSGGVITLKKSGKYMIVGGQSNQYGGTYKCTVYIKKGGSTIDSFSFGSQFAKKYWLGNLDADTVITMTSGSCYNFLIHIIKIII